MLQPVPTEPRNESEVIDTRTQRASAPAAPSPALDPAWRAGRKLTEARVQRGWTIDEVAERIRVRREFLAALEDMNIKMLPGKAYALAFLRSYARELGMDDKAIVDQFQDECALTREDAKQPIRNPTSKPRKQRPWMFAVALVMIAAAIVGWRALATSGQVDTSGEQTAQSAPRAPVAPVSTAAPAAAPSESRVIEVRALTEAWLEARGPDGTVFLSRTLEPGDVYRPDPSPGWTLHARDGAAFELFVNGQSAGPLGAAGMPVLGRQIDAIRPVAQAQAAAPRS